MIQRLDEIIPLLATINSPGGSATVQFENTGKFMEFDLSIQAYSFNKALVDQDTDTNPILVSLTDSRNDSYIRTPTPYQVLNRYFSQENARPYIIGLNTLTFTFSHDQTTVDPSLGYLQFPVKIYCNLLVNYITKEEYNQRVLSARRIQ